MLAVSLVAAAFMAGLALGSYLLGRVADRSAAPLKLYALLEAAIALTALAFPFALEGVENLHLLLAQNFHQATLLSTGSKFLLSATLLIIPTAFMGGTLPVVCRAVNSDNTGHTVARLYALNTGGAVIGCLATAYYMVPHLGMATSSTIAISINLGIAILSFRAARWSASGSADDIASQPRPATSDLAFLCLCVAASGALALGFEILWTRVFLLFLGSTTYAFATILGVYLCGLTLGSLVFATWGDRFKNLERLCFILFIGLTLSVLITLPFYDQLAYLFQALHNISNHQWWLLSGGSFVFVALIILIPTMLFGAFFPAAVQLATPDRSVIAQRVGLLLLCNTLGAMIGSLSVALAGIPTLGLLTCLKTLVVLTALLALTIGWRFRTQLRSHFVVWPILLILLTSLTPIHWNPLLMNSGVYYYNQFIADAGGLAKKMVRHDPLVLQIEGLEATVALYRNSRGGRYFKVNGKTDGSSFSDLATQILLGQLPMLFAPDAKNALVIGLGTGITLDQVAQYRTTHVDCVEISPAVVAISEHFRKENRNVLTQPNVMLHLQDGRNLLRTRPKRYDVIISEPSNPWQAGNAALFTEDFYRLAARRLTATGIFCQWLPLYDLPTTSLKTAIATFLKSFPDTQAYIAGVDILLLGSKAPASESPIRLPSTYPDPAYDLMLFAPNVERLIQRFYFGDSKLLRAFSSGAPLNTDNLPYLEFDRQMGIDRREANFAALNVEKLKTRSSEHPFSFD